MVQAAVETVGEDAGERAEHDRRQQLTTSTPPRA